MQKSDCNAEVSAKVKSALGRDKTAVLLFLFSINKNIKPDIISQSTA